MNNQLIIQTKQELLPAVVKNQLLSTGPIQTVKTEESLALVQAAIIEIEQPLAIAATASELSKAVKKIFILLQKPNSNSDKDKLEFAEYIRLLQGQPLWAVEKAVDKVCKEQSFRDFSKLFKEIKALIEPEVKKIERLKNIYKESLTELEEEKALKQAMDNCPSLEEAMVTAANKGNEFAQDFIRKEHFKVEAIKQYESCNTLGQDFLNKKGSANK